MAQALSFKDKDYNFDVKALKQYSLMDELNYTYLCILLQRARFSSVRAGQRLKAAYESDYIIYLIKGQAIIKDEDNSNHIDETYMKPIFDKDGPEEIVFTDDSFLIRIERPLYDIFEKGNTFQKVLY